MHFLLTAALVFWVYFIHTIIKPETNDKLIYKKKKSLAFSLRGRQIIAVFQTVGLLCFSK